MSEPLIGGELYRRRWKFVYHSPDKRQEFPDYYGLLSESLYTVKQIKVR